MVSSPWRGKELKGNVFFIIIALSQNLLFCLNYKV